MSLYDVCFQVPPQKFVHHVSPSTCLSEGTCALSTTQTLNTIPGNQFFKPGSDKPNGYFSVNASDIDWNLYDIVISINFSIPTNIVKKYPNILWCYLIGENNLHLLNEPKYSNC